MFDWKLIAGIGGFAFIISIFVGLLSGVQFGVLLLRAIGGGIIFAGIGAGLGLLIQKYLPGLVDASPEETRGSNVDIVLDDTPMEAAAEESEKSNNTVIFGEEEQEDGTFSGEAEEFVEEVQETGTDDAELETNQGSDESASPETIETVDEDDKEVVEELTDAEDEVESLPEIDSFSESFGVDEIPDAEGESSSSNSSSGTVDVMGEEQDPRTVAKAIQTLIKRDQ